MMNGMAPTLVACALPHVDANAPVAAVVVNCGTLPFVALTRHHPVAMS
jgi:hypothetical protein